MRDVRFRHHARVRLGRAPLRVRFDLGLALLAACAALVPASARAQVFMTREQALAQAFPAARIERRSFVLGDAELKAVEQAARTQAGSKLVTAYQAWKGDTLVGVAFFDSRVVRTMPAVMMITVAPDSTVRRVDILAFHEPADYRPTARWLDQYPRRRLNDDLWPDRGIRALSGATLTTRAVTDATRLALALYQRVVAPALAKRTAP
ncbi:MAG TPA: FMN-binding protein [Candidatus Udaeobacter sp.]|jgi:Na+-translocating ferredoxin:NAD+ oxidoreductase RnfG subunit|nr:FMN-binding protein [Candidatus Udaeobacter sp.]